MFNWAVLGTGAIVKKFIKGLKAADGARVYAVCSRDLNRAEAFAEKYNIEKAYGSCEEMAEDSEIDCVYIGVPHPFHKKYMELCIDREKNVLCEKPFTMNSGEARYIEKLAKEKQVFVMEAMWTKFLPVIQKVKEAVNSGVIGEVQEINASFGFFTAPNASDRLYNLELGGGALLDVGVYPLNFAVYLMGKLPKDIYSDASIGETGVDEINHMTLYFENGCKTVKAHLASALKENQGADAVIIGAKGRIEIPEFFQADKALVYNERGELIDTIAADHLLNGYEYEAAEVMGCIKEGMKQSEIHSLKDTIDIIDIADGMRQEWGLKYPADIMDK